MWQQSMRALSLVSYAGDKTYSTEAAATTPENSKVVTLTSELMKNVENDKP